MSELTPVDDTALEAPDDEVVVAWYAPSSLLIGLLVAYKRLISPYLGNHCRFYPSCSEYAAKALGRYGVIRGGALAVRRVCRCHPFHPGGVDHVPHPEQESR